MAPLGLALLPLVGLGLIATGLPAFVILIGAAGIGAAASWLGGDAAYIRALPSRLVALLENDLLQALPLFVLMGALLNRLPLAAILFRTIAGLGGGSPAAARVAAIGIGALLAPMNGSVGASAAVLSRAVRPRLAEHGVAPEDSFAALAVASTFGVVVPPSLVLILLGDAMMGAHTIALNASGRSARVVNTQDIFGGVIGPAALLLALTLAVALVGPGRIRASADRPRIRQRLRPGDVAVSLATIAFLVLVLGGVAAGLFYAVEAAAAGAVALLLGGLATRRLDRAALDAVLAEALALTGALFGLLVAATTLTLVLRGLGSDRLVAGAIASLPGGEGRAAAIVLGMVAAAALVLDAFEIIFVVVPLVMPGLLVRVEDAVWVSALTILTLQASYLLPPMGYAVATARAALAEAVPPARLARALLPYLLAIAAVLLATAWLPGLTRLGRRAEPAGAAPLGDREVIERFNSLVPDEAPPPVLLRR